MEQNTEVIALYDRKVLDGLDFTKFESVFKPLISAADPGEDLLVRSLQSTDYNTGFLQLLEQLTTTGNISQEEFTKTFMTMKNCPNTYYVTVIEDTSTGRVVASASLIVEQKFIHQCALRGRLEDVVVTDHCRGKQLGKLLLGTTMLLAEHLGVYKLSLDCRDPLVPYYKAFGYDKEPGNSNFMQIRFRK